MGGGKYAGVNLPSFHHAADGWGNIANCFVVCSSITKFGVMACQYDTASTTFPDEKIICDENIKQQKIELIFHLNCSY